MTTDKFDAVAERYSELDYADAERYYARRAHVLADLYRRAAAFVLPSRYEGFGVPVLEAMASGTPVVLSDDAALHEVAGNAGVYGDLVEGVATALAERERYARAGLARAGPTCGVGSRSRSSRSCTAAPLP